MLRREVFFTSGLVFIIIGSIILLNSFNGITGLVIIEGIPPKVDIFWSIWFLIGGILLIVEGRIHPPSGIEVYISNQALNRSRTDKRVKANIRRYMHEVQMIAADPRQRPQETLGEFHVSPRGHTDTRVAWHMDGNRLYIDDFLYHERDNRYVDKWNEKAAKRKITRKDYEAAGYSKA